MSDAAGQQEALGHGASPAPVRRLREARGSAVGWFLSVTHLQHVQQRRLSGVVEAEEQQLGVLVEQAERREDVVDCREAPFASASIPGGEGVGGAHTPVDNPHLGRRYEGDSFCCR